MVVHASDGSFDLLTTRESTAYMGPLLLGEGGNVAKGAVDVGPLLLRQQIAVAPRSAQFLHPRVVLGTKELQNNGGERKYFLAICRLVEGVKDVVLIMERLCVKQAG